MTSSVHDGAFFSQLRKNVLSAAQKIAAQDPSTPPENVFPNGHTALTARETSVLVQVLMRAASAYLQGRKFKITEDRLFQLTNEVLSPDLRLPAHMLLCSNDGWHHLIDKTMMGAGDATALGYAYQFFCHPLRNESKKRVQSANKESSMREVITFTQLYTPTWVTNFLLAKTILPQWKLEAGSKQAGQINILDPSVGTGHFLLGAFDLLLEMYKREGVAQNEAIPQILALNLHGADIDLIALWICALGLVCKCLEQGFAEFDGITLNLANSHTDDELGSLSRRWQAPHPLATKYDVVIGNPPYIGRKLLGRSLKQQLKTNYPDAHQDLCAAFLDRGLELLNEKGRLGYISQASLMYLPSYGKMRKRIIDDCQIVSVVELGPNVFPLHSGEKVNSALYVLSKQQHSTAGNFIDLTDSDAKAADLLNVSNDKIFRRETSFFLQTRNYAFTYRCPEGLPTIISKLAKLEEAADIRQGLATTDNARFVRNWWEVEATELGKKWFPYAKGAGSERWYSPIETVVNWENNGEEIKQSVAEAYPYLNGKTAWVVKNEQFYFREGLTFSFINSEHLSVRFLPPGCIFDVAGSAVFPNALPIFATLGYLNSSFVGICASFLNPTINFQVGDLKELPLLRFSQDEIERLESLSKEAFTAKRQLYALSDTANQNLDGETAALLDASTAQQAWETVSKMLSSNAIKLKRIEDDIDAFVLRAVQKHTSIDKPTWHALQKLSAQKSSQRPAIALFPADSSQFAKLYLSWKLYSGVPVLNLDTTSLSWLGDQLNSSVPEYLANGFNQDQEKRFRGHPRLTCRFRGDGRFELLKSITSGLAIMLIALTFCAGCTTSPEPKPAETPAPKVTQEPAPAVSEAQSLRNLLMSKLKEGDAAEAVKINRQLVAIDPAAKDFWSSIAAVALEQGDADSLMESSQKTIEFQHHDVEPFVFRYVAARAKGYDELAQKSLKRANKIHPQLAPGLAESWWRDFEKGRKAREKSKTKGDR